MAAQVATVAVPMGLPSVVELDQRFEAARMERAPAEAEWQEIRRYFLPGRSFDRSRRQQRGRDDRWIVDSVGIWALEVGTSGLFSFVTTPTTEWMIARAEDERLNDLPEVTEWLWTVRALVQGVLTRQVGGLYPTLVHYYKDLLAFGTSAFMVEETPEALLFTPESLAGVYVVEDANGRVDQVFREYELRRWEAKRHFAGVPDGDPLERLRFRQWIGRVEDVVRSVHMYDGRIVKLGRFRSFPLIVDRWQKSADESYGRGPGWSALADVKMCQEISKSTVRGAQKRVDPPIITTDREFLGKKAPSLDPGTFVFVNRGFGTGQRAIEPLQINADTGSGMGLLEAMYEKINRHFYVDAFRELGLRGNRSPLKAEEVLGRRQEVFRLLGTVVMERASQMLWPLGDLAYQALQRQRLLPPPPRVLEGERFHWEFTSTAALAQRRAEVEDFTAFIAAASPLFELDPGTARNLDPDYAIRRLAFLHGLPPKMLKLPSVVERQREMDAQREAMAGAAQAAPSAVDALQAVSALGAGG